MLPQLTIAALDVGFVLAAFIVTAACGWWAVAPFRDSLGFPAAVAALAGLVVLPRQLDLVRVPGASSAASCVTPG